MEAIYNIVVVLPYIDMNLPWVYMCSPSWNPLPPSSPSHPSGSSQCTSPEHPVSYIEHFFLSIMSNKYRGKPIWWIGHIFMIKPTVSPHSSTLVWKIPWTQEPGRLQSMGSRRVGHDWEASLSLFTCVHWRRKWQPTPVFPAWRIPGMAEPGGLPSMG